MTLTLVPIGGSYLLHAPAATAYQAMLAAGCPPGHITSAYRTHAQQVALYHAYLNGTGHPANKPGTSTHEIGIALDLAEPTRSWVAAHGVPFGWSRPRRPDGSLAIPNEPWHFEWHTAGPGDPPKPEEDPLYTIRYADTGKCFLWNPATNVLTFIPSVPNLTMLETSFGCIRVEFANEAAFALFRSTFAATFAAPVSSGSTTINVAEVAAAVGDELADDFAAIPDAVSDNAAKRLTD